jgi:hypothetical protein
MQDTPIDRFNANWDAMKECQTAAFHLECVADDLQRVGQDFLADRIREPTDKIKKALKALESAQAMETTAALKDAERSSALVLEAVLTGIDIGQRPA